MSKQIREAILKALGRRWRTNDDVLPEVREMLARPTLSKHSLSDAMGDLIRMGKVEAQAMGFVLGKGSPKRYRVKKSSSPASKP